MSRKRTVTCKACHQRLPEKRERRKTVPWSMGARLEELPITLKAHVLADFGRANLRTVAEVLRANPDFLALNCKPQTREAYWRIVRGMCGKHEILSRMDPVEVMRKDARHRWSYTIMHHLEHLSQQFLISRREAHRQNLAWEIRRVASLKFPEEP